LVLKHFTIGLLSKLRQEVKYEQANVRWSSGGGLKEGGEHGGSSTTNCAIHGENISILDWTRAAEASGSELLHGVNYGTND
jgi:hypothetical protein